MSVGAPPWDNASLMAVREALKGCESSYDHEPGAHVDPERMYASAMQGIAAAVDRPLVVGGRGTGKSYLANALCGEKSRRRLADAYNNMSLGRARCFFGFVNRLGAANAPFAPTAGELEDMLAMRVAPDHIWRAVLCRYLRNRPASPLAEVHQSGETHDAAFQAVVLQTSRQVVMVCDALDRSATNWSVVRKLSRGLMQLALDLRGFKRVNVKVFLRRDQFEDNALFDFPDASKLRTGAVDLHWEHDELYGLLFKWIRAEIPKRYWARSIAPLIPDRPGTNSDRHRAAFEHMAGERMGYAKRGFTYTWVPRHLADTTDRVSPRSFLVAIGRAATATRNDAGRPIDYRGIHEGVRAASQTRVDELKEDHPWIRTVLDDLEGLVVPCPARELTARWRSRQTVSRIRASEPDDVPVDPITLASGTSASDEQALLDALVTLRVAELRKATNKINVPDVYRVAAKIGRRGGVPPLRRRH